MFKVKFTKWVKGGEDDVRLVRVLELPFVPVPDMWINDGEDWDELVSIVTWNNQTEMFEVITPEDDEIEMAHFKHRGHRDFDEIVRDYVANGWDVEEEGEEVEG